MIGLTHSERINASAETVLAEACEQLGFRPFSQTAVKAYKQSELEKVWRKSGLGGYYLATHPGIYAWLNDHWMLAHVGTIYLAVVVVFLALFHPGLLHSVPFVALGVAVFAAGAVMVQFNRVAANGAVGSGWQTVCISKLMTELGAEAPIYIRLRIAELWKRFPQARFYLHTLREDPLVEAILYESEPFVEVAYIGGWYGRGKLVERFHRLEVSFL